jgi:hypothetical protein
MSAEPVPGTLALTGIPTVDEHLTPIFRSGGVIVVAGYGDGATDTLVCQIAGGLIDRSQNVRSVHVWEGSARLFPRMIASMNVWPDEKLPHDRIDGLKWEFFEQLSAVEQLFGARYRIARHLDCENVPDFYRDPFLWLKEELNTAHPSCLIVDEWYEDDESDGVFKMLERYAQEHRIPVIVMCGLNETEDMDGCRAVEVSQLRLKCVRQYADYFIGISNLATGSGETSSSDVRDEEQFITVRQRGGNTSLVPVMRDRNSNRYLPRSVVE